MQVTAVLDSEGSEPSRHRLFATEVQLSAGKTQLSPKGKPYTGLINALTSGKSAVSQNLKRAER